MRLDTIWLINETILYGNIQPSALAVVVS